MQGDAHWCGFRRGRLRHSPESGLMALQHVAGPAWSPRGLDLVGGRYPLRVEAHVGRLVGALLPGVITTVSGAPVLGSCARMGRGRAPRPRPRRCARAGSPDGGRTAPSARGTAAVALLGAMSAARKVAYRHRRRDSSPLCPPFSPPSTICHSSTIARASGSSRTGLASLRRSGSLSRASRDSAWTGAQPACVGVALGISERP